MYQEGENRFYYITTMNENYAARHAEGVGTASCRACTRCAAPPKARAGAADGGGHHPAGGRAAAAMLEKDYQVTADVWSLTSVNQLQREGRRSRAGICCIRRRSRGWLTLTRQLQEATARSWSPPIT